MALDRSALTALGWEHPKRSSRVGVVDTSRIAVDIAGSASHGARSTDHRVAKTPDIAGIANTADTESHPNMDRKPVPVRCGRPRQTKPTV